MQEALASGPNRAGPSSVADRIMSTLEACAVKQTMTLTDLAEEIGLAKSTVHRTCWRLVDLGLLEHDRGGFHIGLKMFELGHSNPSLNDVRVASMPVLLDLQRKTFGLANLAVLVADRALVIDALYDGNLSRAHPLIPRMIGAGLPLHCTAVGKALLASVDESRREQLLGEGMLRPATGHSIVRPLVIRDHVNRVVQAGIATSDEEFMDGVCGAACAVTLDASTTVAIGYTGPCGREVLRRVTGPVREAAESLRHALVNRRPAPV